MKSALIVDDEENDRLYLARMIAVSFPEMEILFAATPAEALFVLEKFKPDILFLDIEMPGLSGLEMLQKLREKHSEMLVIVVSGYNEVDYVKKALRLNVTDYLNKPVDPDELEVAIDKAFNNINPLPLPKTGNKLNLTTDRGTLYIDFESLLYFEANKHTSFVFSTQEENGIIVRENLSSLEKKLPQNMFKRVSRQYIINTKYLKFANKDKYIVLQIDGRQIKLGKIFPHIIANFTK